MTKEQGLLAGFVAALVLGAELVLQQTVGLGMTPGANGRSNSAAELPAASAAAPVLREIHGLEPHRLDHKRLIIQRGSATDAAGQYLITIPASLVIDIEAKGLNGLDTGNPQNNRWYFLYLVHNPESGDSGAVLSLSGTYGNVTYPPGYTSSRKLPFAAYRQADGTFRPYRIFNWPAPYVDYGITQAAALSDGTATSYTPVSLAEWIPPGSQMAALSINARYVPGGEQRTAALSLQPAAGFSSSAQIVARVSASQPSNVESFLPMQTDSRRNIRYWWDEAGGSVDIYVKGYYWIEPD